MKVQAVSVAVPGATIRGYALDLIHDVLVLRLDGAVPVQRGQELPASVEMHGVAQVQGVIVGLEGLIVRFEPRAAAPDHSVIPAGKLTRRAVISGGETIAALEPGLRHPSAANSTFGQRRSAEPPPPPALPARAAGLSWLAEVLFVATGRNELPRRVVVTDITPTTVMFLGVAASDGQRLAITLAPPNRPPIRLMATVNGLKDSSVVADLRFDVPTDQLTLIDAIASLRG